MKTFREFINESMLESVGVYVNNVKEAQKILRSNDISIKSSKYLVGNYGLISTDNDKEATSLLKSMGIYGKFTKSKGRIEQGERVIDKNFIINPTQKDLTKIKKGDLVWAQYGKKNTLLEEREVKEVMNNSPYVQLSDSNYGLLDYYLVELSEDTWSEARVYKIKLK